MDTNNKKNINIKEFDIYEVFRNKFKEKRTEAGITFEELEKLTGIKRSSLQRYESGITDKVPLDAVVKIAAALHVTLGYLMGTEEKAAPIQKNTPALSETPRSERIHIGFFGLRNAGKSSLLNAVTNQELSVVSETKGTTTDPVYKSMELLPLGPVTVVDTPGFDDEGELGEKRVLKPKQVLNKTDIAILVSDARTGLNEQDYILLDIFKEKNIPYIIAYNKADLAKKGLADKFQGEHALFVSAKNGDGIEELKKMLGRLLPETEKKTRLVGDFIKKGDVAVLVTPIDASAPKARLILPQQQAIRDILDSGAIAVTTKETELTETLSKLKNPPALVICDSQVFGLVSKLVPGSIPLTSFSILFARYKGLLNTVLKGAEKIDTLKNGDKILIAEGCTHHRQCEDIGTVKLPAWLKAYTKKELEFTFASGGSFPEALGEYSLIIHCGGCMLPDKEILYRQKCSTDQNIPITNYGTAIAHMNGILQRATKILR